jgi:hypothetical protein
MTGANAPPSSASERFFARVFSLFGVFRLQRPPLWGWSALATQVALVYAATVVVGLAAQQARRPDRIRSPRRGLAHLWEGGAEKKGRRGYRESRPGKSLAWQGGAGPDLMGSARVPEMSFSACLPSLAQLSPMPDDLVLEQHPDQIDAYAALLETIGWQVGERFDPAVVRALIYSFGTGDGFEG